MSGRFSSRAALSAFSVALIFLAASVALQLLSAIVNAIMFGSQTAGLNDLTFLVPTYLWGTVIGLIPFAIGVFLSLWLLLPITVKQSLARVIGTSLLAVAVGAVLAFVVFLVGALFGNFDESAGRVFGWAAGLFSTVSANADGAVVQALYRAVSSAISFIPLTVLAGVVVWIRLRTPSVESASTRRSGEV